MRLQATLPALLLVVLVPFLAAGCATDSSVRAQAADANKELEPAILKDAELVGYMEDIGKRIVASAKERDAAHDGPKTHFEDKNDWMFSTEEFHLVNSKQLNAFTTGGSHLYIYSQLMQQCQSEDELAAVMAHEYAHVYSRHVHKGVDRSHMVLAGGLALGAAGYAVGGKQHGGEYAAYGAGLGMVAGQFLGMGFTRDDEAEADKYGHDFYVHAGWDPAKFGNFFQTLIDKGYDKTPEWQSDHPSLKSRVVAANAATAALPPEAQSWRKPPVADLARFHALQARALELAKTAKSDEQLGKAQLLLAAVPSCLVPAENDEQRGAQEILKQAYAQQHGGTKK